MIVQVRSLHLPLPDERFVFVMDQLADLIQALARREQRPLQVDVVLEAVQRAPQGRRGEPLYRAAVAVDISTDTLRAQGRAHEVQEAIVRMAHRLLEQMGTRPGRRAGVPTGESRGAPTPPTAD